MKVLVVSGIWPPDVGGPASHAPELAAWLASRGHRVEAVVTADAPPAPEPFPVHWVPRAQPPGLRHASVVRLVAARARRADVAYATSMLGRTFLGAGIARRPYVLKVTSDPAFERARRRGLVDGTTAGFQRGGGGGGIVTLALRTVRDASVRRAAHVVCPSSFMAGLVQGWGVRAERVSVLPNPAPELEDLVEVDVGKRPVFVFAGRLTAAKNLAAALRALVSVPGARLLVAGDGEERASLENLARELQLARRVRFLGAVPRGQVLGLLRGADAAVLPSRWENFPHGAVEALAVGTPVVATAVGGVPEVVHDGVNGLLVPPDDAPALAAALGRLLGEQGLRDRLAASAVDSVSSYRADTVYTELETILARAAA